MYPAGSTEKDLVILKKMLDMGGASDYKPLCL